MDRSADSEINVPQNISNRSHMPSLEFKNVSTYKSSGFPQVPALGFGYFLT